MLKPDDLKNWLHRDFSNTNKALLVLSTFDKPVQIAEIKERFKSGGLRKGSEWNLSSLLSGTKGLAIPPVAEVGADDARTVALEVSCQLGAGGLQQGEDVGADMRRQFAVIFAADQMQQHHGCGKVGWGRSPSS